MKRRAFLKTAGGAAALSADLGTTLGQPPGPGTAATSTVTLVIDPADPVVAAPPSRWAITELMGRLQARDLTVRIITKPGQILPGETGVVISGPAFTAPAVMPKASVPPAVRESFTLSNANIATGTPGNHRMLIVAARDPRGLVYALLELADRFDHATAPLDAFRFARPLVEQPANRVRSVLRAFVSEVEDKPWFYDRAQWRDYLTMLATHRFNRINLSFGIGYDFVNEIRDSYLHFAYPFLINVPGYKVQVKIAPRFGEEKGGLLTDDERARNLGMLQYISAAAAERGIDFQLGLWTHAWNFDATPNATHRIAGLSPSTHAEYCRDALHALLVACPGITGVTFRTHGESGVPEESYPFWKTVFSGISAVGRKIEIDQHAKGIDAEMIGLAEATGMPATVSPKYWAEHMGLPYHQAAIRPNEMPQAAARNEKGALMALSTGSRNFMRYGYGDLLREDRKFAVLHRIWPGTQRLLLWGDPLMAAAYGRASSFAGTDGVEWMEPLSFKGRKGSGLAGGRNGYLGVAPPSVNDWEKYLYTYRIWGRAIYNPASNEDSRKRFLKKRLGTAAEGAEAALALSSRILPTITTAHMPSAANANYWPEIYTNQSIVIANARDPYSDTPAPRRFGTVSPLDSQLFSTVDECAEELLSGRRAATFSPVEVASWLEELAHNSDENLAAAGKTAAASPEFQRWAVDISIQNSLGRFFAAKFRSGVLYGIYSRSGDPAAREEALKAYRSARDAWKAIIETAANVYRPDLTFGYTPQLRGTWRDRLKAIEDDIAAMEAAKADTTPTSASAAIALALSTPRRPAVALQHLPVKRFRPGIPVVIEAALPTGVAGKLNLCYRHVNQAEKWRTAPMEARANGFHSSIPAEYASSPYPLQYYFEVHLETGDATLFPGLPRDFSAQPYYVIRRA